MSVFCNFCISVFFCNFWIFVYYLAYLLIISNVKVTAKIEEHRDLDFYLGNRRLKWVKNNQNKVANFA